MSDKSEFPESWCAALVDPHVAAQREATLTRARAHWCVHSPDPWWLRVRVHAAAAMVGALFHLVLHLVIRVESSAPQWEVAARSHVPDAETMQRFTILTLIANHNRNLQP